MLKTITRFLGIASEKPDINFFDLSTVEKKQMMEKATEKANKDQKALMAEYDKKFDRAKICNCKP